MGLNKLLLGFAGAIKQPVLFCNRTKHKNVIEDLFGFQLLFFTTNEKNN